MCSIKQVYDKVKNAADKMNSSDLSVSDTLTDIHAYLSWNPVTQEHNDPDIWKSEVLIRPFEDVWNEQKSYLTYSGLMSEYRSDLSLCDTKKQAVETAISGFANGARGVLQIKKWSDHEYITDEGCGGHLPNKKDFNILLSNLKVDMKKEHSAK